MLEPKLISPETLKKLSDDIYLRQNKIDLGLTFKDKISICILGLLGGFAATVLTLLTIAFLVD